MAKKVARLLLTLAGAAVGVGLVALANRVITFPEGLTLYQRMLPWGLALVFVGSGTIIAIIFNLLFAEPLTAAVVGAAFFSEKPTGWLIIGTALIFTAVALLSKTENDAQMSN